jgi:hypothetical protein
MRGRMGEGESGGKAGNRRTGETGKRRHNLKLEDGVRAKMYQNVSGEQGMGVTKIKACCRRRPRHRIYCKP